MRHEIDVCLGSDRSSASRGGTRGQRHLFGRLQWDETVWTDRIDERSMGFERFTVGKRDSPASSASSLLAFALPLPFSLDREDVFLGVLGKDWSIGRHGNVFFPECRSGGQRR